MKLREITLKTSLDTYAEEFFTEVSKKPEGKLFAFEFDLKETTVRSLAQTYGRALGTKFTVVTIPGETAPPSGNQLFAIGVTTKSRQTRKPKKDTAPPIEVSAELPPGDGQAEDNFYVKVEEELDVYLGGE